MSKMTLEAVPDEGHVNICWSWSEELAGYGIMSVIPVTIEEWPALRAAIDEMLTPKPDKHAPLYAAMRKTPR